MLPFVVILLPQTREQDPSSLSTTTTRSPIPSPHSAAPASPTPARPAPQSPENTQSHTAAPQSAAASSRASGSPQTKSKMSPPIPRDIATIPPPPTPDTRNSKSQIQE